MNEFIEPLRSWLTWLIGTEPDLKEMILIPMLPLFIAGFLFELHRNRRKSGRWGLSRGESFHLKEVLANFSLGGGYFISGAILNIIYVNATFEGLWDKRLFTVPLNVWTAILAFFVVELCYYVYHRTSHRVRWFWTYHVAHHTGEIMNMSTAARQSVLNGVVGTWMFYVPPVLLGFSPELVLGLLGLNLAFQWFVHTESIPKLHPWLEWVLNTPSNHRVHHGRNPQYVDKNYGGILMIYDHLFNSYAVEEEKVEYGTPRQIRSYNWLVLNLHEFVDMWRDAIAPGPILSRLKHFWKPPEWERDNHDPIHTWTVERKTTALIADHDSTTCNPAENASVSA